MKTDELLINRLAELYKQYESLNKECMKIGREIDNLIDVLKERYTFSELCVLVKSILKGDGFISGYETDSSK